MEDLEFTQAQAQDFLRASNLTQKRFYRNVFGWEVSYSLKPTWMTPTGKYRTFPRTKLITL